MKAASGFSILVRRLAAVVSVVSVLVFGVLVWWQASVRSDRRNIPVPFPQADVQSGAKNQPASMEVVDSRSPSELAKYFELIDQALEFSADGNDERATELMELLTISGIPSRIRSEAYRHLGQIAWKTGDQAKAAERFSQVLKLVQSGEVGGTASDSSEASALNQLFVLRRSSKDLAGALEANSAILTLLRGAIPDGTWASANVHQAMILDEMGRTDEALPFVRSGLEIQKELDLPMYAKVLHYEASLRERTGDLGGAVVSLHEAWDVAQRTEGLPVSGSATALFNALRRTNNDAAMAFARDAFNTLNALPAQRRAVDPDVGHVEISLLSSLCGAYNLGRPDLSQWAMDLLEARAGSNDSLRESVRSLRADMERTLREANLPK